MPHHEATPGATAAPPAARRWLLAFVMLAALGAPSLAASPVTTPPPAPMADAAPLHLAGFATLGLARSSTDQAEFVRDLSQPGGVGRRWSAKIDSVLGIQGNLRLGQPAEAVAQVVSRYGPQGDFRPELTWAFLKLEPDSRLQLRGGRLGTEFYMLADSRWVGYANLTVRPPGDYFGNLPFYYIDGADATATLPLTGSLLRGKLFSGLSRETAPLGDRQWDLDGSRLRGGHLEVQAGGWQARLGYSKIRFSHELPEPVEGLLRNLNAVGAFVPSAARAAAELAVRGTTSRFHSLGVVYDAGPLQAQLMLSRTLHESATFENSRAGYLLAGYRVADVTPFVGYSWVKSSPKTVNTGIPPALPGAAQLDAGVAAVMADTHSDQHTLISGVRWDLRRNTAVKFQWDAIRGTPQSIFPFRREQTGWSGHANVVSLALDVVF